MKINLKDLEIVYINLSTYVNRNQSMLNMFDHYGMSASRVEGVGHEMHKGYDLVADAHLKALNYSSAERVLILEDDCIPHDYREEFEVPDDADIVYLGMHGHKHHRERVSPEVWKISEMLASHAILYLTPDGKNILRQAHELTREKKYPFDVSLARLQKTVNTYALNSPIWYQKDYPELTKFNLDELEGKTIDLYGGGPDDYDEPISFSSVRKED
jgi:peptidoglycan/xylan/chitin deacetylase (PgdA/CDA1 family)